MLFHKRRTENLDHPSQAQHLHFDTWSYERDFQFVDIYQVIIQPFELCVGFIAC